MLHRHLHRASNAMALGNAPERMPLSDLLSLEQGCYLGCMGLHRLQVRKAVESVVSEQLHLILTGPVSLPGEGRWLEHTAPGRVARRGCR